MRWLNDHEFTDFEKCCAGVESWPNWHWPVILLYAGDIAVNQLPLGVLENSPGHQEMDHGSTDTDPLPDTIKHLHCWHTEDMFSKFRFQSGEYDKLNLEGMTGMKTPRDYATVLAISSSRLNPENFRIITSDPSAVRSKKWLKF